MQTKQKAVWRKPGEAQQVPGWCVRTCWDPVPSSKRSEQSPLSPTVRALQKHAIPSQVKRVSAISTTSRDKVSVFLELFTAGEQPLVWSGRGQLVTVMMDTRTTPVTEPGSGLVLYTPSHTCVPGEMLPLLKSLKRPRDEPLQ